MAHAPQEPTTGGLHSPLRSLSRRRWVVAYAVVSAGYVLFCVHQPMSMNTYAGHDDFYFVSDARSILAGHWLGDFNQLTLIKGPGFTYFLVINNVIGLPLSMTLALVLVAACACVCAAVQRVTRLGPLGTFALFALLLLQPAVIPDRVIRDAFYHSLFLFVVAGLIYVAFDGRQRGRVVRGALAGFALGWFWITREEGLWIAPGVIVLFGVQAWRYRKVRAGRVGALVSVGVMVLVATIPVLATSAVNKEKYGAYTVTDMASGPFRSALNELDRIDVGPNLQRVPVSRRALAAAYKASPAAREMKPFLDGPGGTNWGAPTCELYPEVCGEIAGGWISWAIRDAAASAGHFRTESEARSYFNRISEQISAACSRGALKCRTNPIPILPVLTRETLLDLPGAMARAARHTTYADADPPSIPSVGPSSTLEETGDLLGRPLLSRTIGHGLGDDSSHWLGLKVDLTKVFRVIMSAMVVVGPIALLIALMLRRRRRPIKADVLLLAVFAWLLYFSRLGLVAFVDVSAAPAVNTQYLEPAFLALGLAGYVSLLAMRSGLRKGSRHNSSSVFVGSSRDWLRRTAALPRV